jgi:hypothetical protein
MFAFQFIVSYVSASCANGPRYRIITPRHPKKVPKNALMSIFKPNQCHTEISGCTLKSPQSSTTKIGHRIVIIPRFVALRFISAGSFRFASYGIPM